MLCIETDLSRGPFMAGPEGAERQRCRAGQSPMPRC